LLLGVVAVWLFWIRVWMAHARIHQFITNGKNADDEKSFLLEQSAQLAYIGLSIFRFAALGLLNALWRVVAH
jgi:hypothetical protein